MPAMKDPLDSRPQQTVNRLRFVVILPLLAAVVGVGLLTVKLAEPFRAQPEPSAADQPANSAALVGAPARPKVPAAALPKAPARTAEQTNLSAKGSMTSPGNGGIRRAETTAQPAVVASAAPTLVSATGNGGLGTSPALARDIVGRVLLRGTPPPEKEIPMDPSCGKFHTSPPKTRFYVVSTNGELADVFVGLVGLPDGLWQPPTASVEIHQRGCEYQPYVNVAQAGQIIRVFNGDPLMHNVHPTPTVEGDKEQNKAQLPNGAPLDFIFTNPEQFLRFKCDVHPWMFAYVSIVEHPFFAVSTADGRFAITAPPAGDYTLQFIHRKAGGRAVPVKVAAGKRLVVTVTLDIEDHARSEASVMTEE